MPPRPRPAGCEAASSAPGSARSLRSSVSPTTCRSRRYGFTSDAGHRFERGVDFANNVEGIERATRLILDICGGEPGPTEDLVARLPERKPVRMRVARAQKIIGMAVPGAEMQKCF